MSGFSWFLLSIGSIIFFMAAAAIPPLLFRVKGDNLSLEEEVPLPVDSVFDVEKRNAFLKVICECKSGIELQAHQKHFSSLYYNELCHTQQALQKLGLQRKIEFTAAPLSENSDRETSSPYINADGLVEVYETVKGCYTETITDIYSGKAVKECRYPKINVKVQLCLKPPPPETPCPKCGGELVCVSRTYDCEKCRTSYSPEAYKWVAGGFSVEEPDNAPSIGKADPKKRFSNFMEDKIWPAVIAIFLFGSPILSFFVKASPAIELFLKVSLFLSVSLAILLCIVGTVTGIRRKKTQKMEIAPHAGFIAVYLDRLTKELFFLRDTAPANVKPYMSDMAYAQWCSEYFHEGDYLVELTPSVDSISFNTAQQEGELDFVKFCFSAKASYLDKYRVYHTDKRDITMWLYSRRESKKNNQIITATVCEGCGKISSVFSAGACPYCGRPFVYEDIAWKLDYMNYASIFEWGEKIYGTY